MAKYSTGRSSGNDEGETCELCGASSETLQSASIAGARLSVCQDCAPHDDAGPAGQSKDAQASQDDREGERRRRAAQHAASIADARSGDSDYWVEQGTNYESDPLPYLVSEYGERLQTSRREEGLTIEELAEEAGVSVQEVEAIEQHRAARAGVGGSAVEAIEATLDISLVEEN